MVRSVTLLNWSNPVRVYIFSARPSVTSRFKSLVKSKLFELRTADPANLKQTFAQEDGYTLAYLDASHFSNAQISRILKESAASDNRRIGIIDGTGAIEDPGRLFHDGAVDYLAKKTLQGNVTASRIQKAISYCNFEQSGMEEAVIAVPTPEWKLSGSSWKNVKSGQEYTFCFMYVEIDQIDEWKNRSGRTHLDEVKATFQNHLKKFAEGISGRIWMWMDLCGVLLFPFDGTRCDPILDCMRLVLNRSIISAEKYLYHTTISYKLALHIGNTVYRSRGNTGTIVSDAVNFLFHIGSQFAEPGNFYLTEPVARFIPKKLKNCFVPAGTFEEVEIKRMRLPVSPQRRPTSSG